MNSTAEELVAVAAGCASPEATAHVARELENEQSEASRLMHALFAEAAAKEQNLNGSRHAVGVRRTELETLAESLDMVGMAAERVVEPTAALKRATSFPVSMLRAAVILLVAISGFGWYTAQASLTQTKEALDQTAKELEEFKRRRIDNFEKDWLDPRKWKTGRRKTTAQDGYARLNDRGSLITVEEFKGPHEIEFDWRWIDIAGDISYRDTFAVVLHTTGTHQGTHPFEMLDGIAVVLQTHSGQAAVVSPPIRATLWEATPEGSLPMPAGKWHHVRIVDNGSSIAVYISGPSIEPKNVGKPVLTVPYKGDFQKHHIAFYNREIVAGALHESHFDNVSIRPLTAAKNKQ